MKSIDKVIDDIITPFKIGDYCKIVGENGIVKIIDIFNDLDSHKRYARVVPDWNEDISMAREVLYSRLRSTQ